MLHLKSPIEADLVDYCARFNARLLVPYCSPFGNLAAQADPASKDAMWACDIENPAMMADGVRARTATQLAALPEGDPDRVPFPASAEQWQCSYIASEHPDWFNQIVV